MRGILAQKSLAWPLPMGDGEPQSAKSNRVWPVDQGDEQGAAGSPSLRTFAEGLAHKLNNYLTIILGNTALMREHVPPNQPVLDMLHRIETTGLDAENLVRQVLLYAQQAKSQLKRVDLSRLVDDVLIRFKNSVASNHALVYEFNVDLPEILADPLQMRRLIASLLANASEAIGDDPGMILLRTKALHLSQTALAAVGCEGEVAPGHYVWLQVGDTGCGMDEEISQHIFEPFFSTKFIGRGLGLSAALGIVRDHRGTIWVDSTPGEGTTVHILLPCADFSKGPAELMGVCPDVSEPGTYFG